MHFPLFTGYTEISKYVQNCFIKDSSLVLSPALEIECNENWGEREKDKYTHNKVKRKLTESGAFSPLRLLKQQAKIGMLCSQRPRAICFYNEPDLN
jgi:hypothetical protein